MIAAAQVAVAPVDELDGHLGNVALRGIDHRAGELARGRIVLASGGKAPLQFLAQFLARRNAFGEQAHRGGIAAAGVVMRIADDVVGDHRLDVDSPRAGALRPVRRAQQSLLLAGHGEEGQRGGKAMLRHRAGELDHHRSAGCVVVGAGRVAFGVHHVAAHRVVVARHDERASPRLRIVSLERGHHVGHRRRGRRARRGRLHEFVHLDLEAAAGVERAFFEGRANPPPRRADAAPRIVGGRQRMSRSESGQRAHVAFEPLGRYGAHQRLDIGVGAGRRVSGACRCGA